MSNAHGWNIDPTHSRIGFSVRHLVISKVRGHFDRHAVTLDLDEANPVRSKIEARIETASINTADEKRDAHLRSADFFDAEKYPIMTFVSRSIERGGDGYQVVGDLTIKDVTRPVTLEVEDLGRNKDPWGGYRAGFSARTSINRKDFGLTWNVALETGGVLVGDKIEIELDVQAIGQARAAVA